ncbi:mast cell carboxypeptidase A-like [Hyla sarda]|uniref:mast cell carboxypeptidase A-like n=1 Tax=Hyla sarda TaxID=327740 RepID=UPI0024C3C9CA|nr:mast cell carboxypeptidase A-like [Hyla sarda]
MKLFLLLCSVAVSLSVPHGRRFDNEKLFHVTPKSNDEVQFIKYLDTTMKLDFWKPKYFHNLTPKTNIYFHADAQQSKEIENLLEEKGIKYRVVFHDLQEAIENQFTKRSKYKKGFNRYREWKEIAVWAYSVSLKYPKLASIVQIGETYEGRPMLVIKIGNQISAKKGIFLDCGIHAREWISPAFCQWFVKEAIRTYGKDKEMTKLLNSFTFHVLPVFNVDGYVFSWTSDRLWRKNRAPTPNDKCTGTDLNRNFNASWNGIHFDDEPCSEAYAGSAPESAPEVKAVASYIRENLSALKAYISVHSFSQLLLYPYGYTEKEASNHKKLDEIAKASVEALQRLYNTSYTYGSIATTIYPVCGSSADWVYDLGIKYTFVFELRDEGRYGFLLPEHDIEPTCKETMMAVKQIASNLIDLDI